MGIFDLEKMKIALNFQPSAGFRCFFSAGMGIGMLFFGVAEPMSHYLFPPYGQGETLQAARQAMGITLFHWCLHPWGLYALVALALAYFSFRKDLPLSFRSVLHPIIGKKIYGWQGDLIDVLAVLATLFGLATSLGLGAKQVNAGLNYVFGIPQGTWIQIIIIAAITSMAVASLVSGLNAGIRRLSEINMGIAGFLLIFLCVTGPTLYLLNAFVENIGGYLQRLPHHSFWTATYESDSHVEWSSGWTIFYWGWWIAWSPFVGMFIARISKGRTIREFICGVLLVPTAVAIIWMTVFGNTALHQEIYAKISRNPKRVEKKFNYFPKKYPVQVIDKKHKLPVTPDGKWLIGCDSKNHKLLLKPQEKKHYSSKSGKLILRKNGVLIDKNSGKKFHINGKNSYKGPYKAIEKELTLGGYLSQKILTPNHSTRVDTTATAMFLMFKAYPLSWLMTILGVISVVLFFVTSSDSASMVADIIASGGSQNPTLGTRLFWGILEGVLAAVLLMSGGLVALQTCAITIGLPFCIIIIIMAISLYIALRREVNGKMKEAEEKKHS